MSLQIVYGRSGTGKTNYIFEDISNNILSGNKYIITPEQFSFSAEKELLKKVKEKTNSASVINAEVLTFNRMAHRALKEIGGAAKVTLTNSGKAMIIYKLLSDQKNKLTFLGKSDNNIDMVLTQITELKKHGVQLDDLKYIREKSLNEDIYLSEKLNDLYTIYEKFESTIQNKYIDENDNLTNLIDMLDDIDSYDNSDIYIDEFVGFTKQEYLIIEKLLKKARRLTVTICTDNSEESANLDSDIFYSSKITLKKLLEIAKNNKIEIERPIFLNQNKRFKNDELICIEDNIYNNIYKKYEKESIENVKLFLANNRYSEIENVAKNIIKLVRDESYRYKDIAIITKNIDTYSSITKAIFNEYSIPVFIDEKKDLNQNILMKYVLSILDIFAKSWSYESMINYMKTGFIELSNDIIYKLENYALKWNIKGNKWYKEEWNFHDDEIVGKENIEIIREARRIVVNPVINLRNKLTNSKTVKDITNKIYEFLIDNHIDEKLNNKIKILEIKNADLAFEYKNSWDILINAFDELVMIYGDEKISFDSYMNLLKTGLSNEDLGVIPQSLDEVIMGDISRSRNNKIKAIFIIGLNDGIFPSVNREEGFLNDKDRDRIKALGIELAKGTLENIYEDNFNIYKAFTTAENKIYLSYASSDDEGKALRPSVLVKKIKNIFVNIKENSDIISENSEITTKLSTFEELLLNIRKYIDGEKIDNVWLYLYNKYKEDEKYNDRLKKAMKAIIYSNNPERITEENIRKIYGDSLKTSISQMEKYKGCPFSYYLKYNLNLNDKDYSKIQSIDTGSIMHSIIDKFFTYLEENNLNIREISETKQEEIINKLIDDETSLNRNYIFKSSDKYINLVKRLKKVLLTSMKYIVQSITNSSFNVLGHEVEFGENAKYEPITFYTDSGKKVEIKGKIDRIDIAKNNDGTYVRIIDYKSSAKDLDLNEVKAGIRIQLLTYLNETCRKEDFIPAGVLYFNLLDATVKSKKKMEIEEIENEIKKQFQMKGLIVADVNIIKMMDNKIEDGKTSNIISAGLKNDGEINNSKTSGAVTNVQFENLQKYMNKLEKQISEEILSGNINILPYYSAKKQSPCEYCKYNAICNFDTSMPNNKYRYIEKLKKEEVIANMEEESKENKI